MTGMFRRFAQAGGARLARKAARSVPFVGTVVALGLAGYEIRKKGFLRGSLNVALDATPFVGATKNVLELFTGDWFADKQDRKGRRATS